MGDKAQNGAEARALWAIWRRIVQRRGRYERYTAERRRGAGGYSADAAEAKVV